jgi:SAM-dependent methyltransferase
MSGSLAWLGNIHRRLVGRRRVGVLAGLLAARVPAGCSVLDVGCGDGQVGQRIREQTGATVEGLEVLVRPDCAIPLRAFDGRTIPLADKSVDVCLFVDVLHHTDDPAGLLREARRVARRAVLIKDHCCRSGWDRAVLTFMDWIGNRPHGVRLVYNYQSHGQWQALCRACALRVERWDEQLGLYPAPANWLFGRRLHFVAVLGLE